MKILVTGGCKNGKSFYAQELMHSIANKGNLFYVATMEAADGEDNQRIIRHKEEREGYGFETLEQPRDLINILPYINDKSTVLLDSSTALLSNEMFLPNGELNREAGGKIITELTEICSAVKNIAVVSDWIYGDAGNYDELTEHYRKSLASIDRAMAKVLDVVCEVSFGHRIIHKGELV